MSREFLGVVFIFTIIALGALALEEYGPGSTDPLSDAEMAEAAAASIAQAQSERPDPRAVMQSATNRRRDMDPPDPTEIMLAPETGIGLGWGWNAFHGEAIPTQCVEFSRDKPFAGQTSTLDFTEINDQYELQAAMDMSAEASVKTMGYEVEGEMKFSAETSVSGTSLTYLIEAEVLNAPWIALPPGEGGGEAVRLTKDAAQLASRDLELFKDVCGTGYISATYGGAKLSVVAEITTFSEATRTAMSSSVSGGGWGAKVSAAMSGSASSGTEKATRKISFHQSGGKPEKLPTSAEDIFEITADLGTQADTAEKIFRISVTPYEVLENWPREDSLTGSDLEYEELAALWGSYRSLYTGLQEALDEPKNYIVPSPICSTEIENVDGETVTEVLDSCGTVFVSATERLQHIRDMQDDVIIWLDRLELAARACVTAEELCETDVALYRTPYAYQVSMPVHACLFGDPDIAAYDAKRRAVYDELYSEENEADPKFADFYPDIEPTCTVTGLDTAADAEDAARDYAELMIEDVAKSRCALSSLTPGCLTNAHIAAWSNRIGYRSLIFAKDSEIDALQQAVADAPADAIDTDVTCSRLKNAETWQRGDPGAPLKTSVWVPAQCLANIQSIAENPAKEDG